MKAYDKGDRGNYIYPVSVRERVLDTYWNDIEERTTIFCTVTLRIVR